MTILEKISADITAARRNQNKVEVILLTTLLGELQRNPKKLNTDDDVIKALSSYVKGLNERARHFIEKDLRQPILDEIALIKERYLPKQMEYDDLLKLITENSFSNVKEMMAFLSNHQKETGLLIDRAAAKQIFEDTQI
jgi:uncharacterized protein YqeY